MYTTKMSLLVSAEPARESAEREREKNVKKKKTKSCEQPALAIVGWDNAAK